MKKNQKDHIKHRIYEKMTDKSDKGMPCQFWQVNLNLTPKGDSGAAGAFLPKPAQDRPCTHVKTNECDH